MKGLSIGCDWFVGSAGINRLEVGISSFETGQGVMAGLCITRLYEKKQK
jgi:hypothetical protein